MSMEACPRPAMSRSGKQVHTQSESLREEFQDITLSSPSSASAQQATFQSGDNTHIWETWSVSLRHPDGGWVQEDKKLRDAKIEEKKERNRRSAKQSRERRKQEYDQDLRKYEKLEAENQDLRKIISALNNSQANLEIVWNAVKEHNHIAPGAMSNISLNDQDKAQTPNRPNNMHAEESATNRDPEFMSSFTKRGTQFDTTALKISIESDQCQLVPTNFVAEQSKQYYGMTGMSIKETEDHSFLTGGWVSQSIALNDNYESKITNNDGNTSEMFAWARVSEDFDCISNMVASIPNEQH